MLHLKRKIGQTFMIGNNIEITILGIDGNSVKLGCSSPKEMPILRKEQYSDIKKENLSAISTDIESLNIFNEFLKKN